MKSLTTERNAKQDESGQKFVPVNKDNENAGENDNRSGGIYVERAEAFGKLPPEVERWRQQAEGTFWGLVGCEIKALSERQAVVSLDITRRHLNLIGIVHGGVYATMIDSAMGLAAMMARPQENVVTSGLNLHYLAPTGSGRMIVTADIAHQSRKTVTVQAEARTEGGDLLALGTGSFRVIGRRLE